MSEFISQHAILTEHQYGFRDHHSTYMALLKLIDKVAHELDNKSHCLGIFLDLSKAFDTLNHSILIKKLECYGFRGIVLSWLESYLSDRKQFVTINNEFSNVLQIRTGVPQGSILGPLLFILYINDLVNVNNDVQLLMFADDTNMLMCDNNINSLEIRANLVLRDVSQWFKLNKLSLNVKKCNFMIFTTKKLNYDITLKIDNLCIDKVTKTKFLGVIINEKLSWENHIQLIMNKVSKSIGILRRIQNKIPDIVLRNLYFTLVNPYFEYCNLIWATSPSGNLNKLFRLQKRAIRLITKSKWNEHTSPLFINNNILTLYKINQLQTVCFMYKIKNKLLPSYFVEMFELNSAVHEHNTRLADSYHVQSHRLNLTSHSIRIIGVKLWNNICNTLKCVETLNMFRTKLRYHLINN
jgi:hypothetical protein